MIHSSLSDGLCVLHLAAPPLNTIDFALLHRLEELLGRATADRLVRGILIHGEVDHFSAGADLHLFEQIETATDAVRISRVFQGAFRVIEECPKPVAVALAGRVMGSALELASACHWRVATPTSRFSMPEVSLGINPGAGGTQRLPRLMGVEAALRMLLDGETLDARRALEVGLIDRIAAEGELLDACRHLAEQGVPRRTCARTDRTSDRQANAAAFAEAQTRIASVRGEIIAPRMILEAVRTGLEQSFAAGLEFEQAAFAECMATPAARNKIYLFFARRATGKEPAGVTASPLERAAVVGMGTMGTGIVQALISAGIPTTVRDEEQRFLDRGRERIRASLEKRVSQGKMTAARAGEILDRLTTTTCWEDLAGAGLVVEAVPEELTLKQAVLERLEQVCSEALMATNTSTLSLDALAAGLRRPERLLGLHFFNPAHHMPLVEVIRREATPADVVATGLRLVRTLGKTPVLVRNREGFVVNRLFIPYLQEAFALLEEGAAPADIDRAMVEFGMPMGPLAVSDLAGLDVLAWAQQVLAQAFARHGKLSPIVARLLDRGDLGQKTGAGVYAYERGDPTPLPSAAADEIVAAVREERDTASGAAAFSADEICTRLVLRMVCEAFYVVAEGVVERESDVDVATVLGTGFPEFRGGPIRYARDRGLDRVNAELENLARRLGPRFAPVAMRT
jgi:3-hydroxyacyl-CoA dehydrogenase